VNPVSIEIDNPDGQPTAAIQAAYGGTADNFLAGGSETYPLSGIPQANYTAWTSYQYSHKQLVSTRVYYAIPASGAGTAAANYDETDYGYNAVGAQEWTETPAGTITWSVLDAQRQTVSTWEGTNDADATASDPTGGATGQAAGNNMVDVTDYRYNADGDVTQVTQHVDSNSAHDRTTLYGYDWRDRQTYVVNPPDAQGSVSYTMTTYDNLDEATESQQYLYQGDAGQIPTLLRAAAADPPTPLYSTDALLAQSTTHYDSLGRVYEEDTYLVADGVAAPTPQTTTTQYDTDGNEIALTDPDGYETSWQYNGLGQMTSETNAAQTNAIGENDQYRYDAAGELTEKIDADGRAITYSYDGIGRETAENWYASVNADGSPHGGATETISYLYDPAGRLQTASDANATYSCAGSDPKPCFRILLPVFANVPSLSC
jgi:YD repeat-containing protein